MHGRNAVANAPDPIPIHTQPRHPPRISLDLFAFNMIFPTTFVGNLLLLEFRALMLSGFYSMGISVVRVSCCWVNWESCGMQRSTGRMVMVMRRTYVLVGHETVSIGLLQTTDFRDLDTNPLRKIQV
jgi:hypothetical protein